MNKGLNTNDKFAFIWMAIVMALLCAFYAGFIKPESSVNCIADGNTVYVTEGNIFRACFKEPFERLVLLMRDGNAITYTTHHEYCVHISFGYLRHSLQKKGYEISDVIFCIHNHLVSAVFSKKDKDFCRYMKNDGFTGVFALYHRPSKRVIIYDEEN